ncbi:hypothetical protein WJX84_006294 [Apatococcus fuscideae]|uniref:Cytochrome b6-f complex subunit 7 n=1 Tax=Apatococcus fuscideae TaxID=2026836 RepID=A0AAW1SDH0_9CHLO
MATAATTTALLTRQAPISCSRRPAPLGALPGLSRSLPLRRSSQPLPGSSQQCGHTSAAPSRGTLQTAQAMEVCQIANEGAFIGGTAAVTFAIVLVGLAIGFVLLRVEALVEEGKL